MNDTIPTPITDAAKKDICGVVDHVDIEIVCSLERRAILAEKELSELRTKAFTAGWDCAMAHHMIPGRPDYEESKKRFFAAIDSARSTTELP